MAGGAMAGGRNKSMLQQQQKKSWDQQFEKRHNVENSSP